MGYTIHHRHVTETGAADIVERATTTRVRFAGAGVFSVRHPGLLKTSATLSYTLTTPAPRGVDKHISLALDLKIFTPDGAPFTASQVTLADLRRFRDLQGVSQGQWRWEASGQAGHRITNPDPEAPRLSISQAKGQVQIGLDETVALQDTAPLVSTTLGRTGARNVGFDLFRIGRFVAKVTASSPLSAWQGLIQLKDPDGQVMATSTSARLELDITQRLLARSRGPGGVVRPWTLSVVSQTQGIGAVSLSATVRAQARVSTAVLQSRLDELIGPAGNKFALFGDEFNGMAVCRLKILDRFSAETLDMHGLLDARIRNNAQPPEVDTDNLVIREQVAYVLGGLDKDLGHGVSVDVRTLKLSELRISLGASSHLQPAMPALRLALKMAGKLQLKLAGVTVGTGTLRNGQLALEVGLTRDATGTWLPVPWINDQPVDLDLSAAALLGLGPLGAAVALAGVEFFEHKLNDAVVAGFKSAVADMAARLPHIVAVLMGGYFDVQAPRLEGGDIVLDHAAPNEPEPKPSPLYSGAIGRDAISTLGGKVLFVPRSLGDTWKADNLNSKIEHIVMVMMENRSFDQVLGYRAQLPGGDAVDGLGPALLAELAAQGFAVPKLKDSAIAPNAQGLKTRFPVSVGHHRKDVLAQLAQPLALASGRAVNNPKSLMDNFTPGQGLVPNDVLGWYEATDLPFYKYLADNYAYCDRYFSAHPGPTLPNRMFALTGDLQYDRVGEAIEDNNHSDNFYLSRAPTLFDLLSRQGRSWRVYESFPSVAMLRFFARYATDNTNILPIARLEGDIAAGNLANVTMIEPAMHHAPQDDDHPTADMVNGQRFVKRVYEALRANPELWRKTLLVITYDEHGGFYDHVVPPTADLRSRDPVLGSGVGAASSLATRYGLRVPTFVVSPWVPAGKGPSLVLDHCSILKTVLARFCGKDSAFLSDRVAASQSFEAFLSLAAPRLSGLPPRPTLPPLPQAAARLDRVLVTAPVSRQALKTGQADFHELGGLLARTLGRR